MFELTFSEGHTGGTSRDSSGAQGDDKRRSELRGIFTHVKRKGKARPRTGHDEPESE